jgi:hypothetical protein
VQRFKEHQADRDKRMGERRGHRPRQMDQDK